MNEVPLATLKCGHQICARCLHSLLKQDSHCCICRNTIVGCTPPVIVSSGTHMVHTVELQRVDENESFGITLDQELNVTKVHEHSIAYATGVRTGQKIIEINGLPCYSKKVVANILSAVGRFHIGLMTPPPLPQECSRKNDSMLRRCLNLLTSS
jgi:hypothetical protein